jgi:hypothetical protein
VPADQRHEHHSDRTNQRIAPTIRLIAKRKIAAVTIRSIPTAK